MNIVKLWLQLDNLVQNFRLHIAYSVLIGLVFYEVKVRYLGWEGNVTVDEEFRLVFKNHLKQTKQNQFVDL